MTMTNKSMSAIESDKLLVFNPKYRDNKNKRITILRVVIDNEYTRVDFYIGRSKTITWESGFKLKKTLILEP